MWICNRDGLSPTAVFEPLRRLILDELQKTRAERMQQGFLFSASHLNFLWDQAMQQGIMKSPRTSIDCLQVAREKMPVNPALKDCLAEFLEQ